MRGGATFNATGAYRYHLWREWDSALPPVIFIMLNPSTADAERSDGTIRRCIGFARSWGYGRLEVFNVFAYRAVTPRELFAAADPVGPDNGSWLSEALKNPGQRVLAWGNHGSRMPPSTRRVLWSADALCLGLTLRGEPVHPLRIEASRRLVTLGEALAASPSATPRPSPRCPAQ